jgi:4-amino-4-deoxy-L-arabinose transferase-like glycosyltransferase
LFALLAFLLLFKLGATPIYILDEAKNAQCAREMLQRHDWIVPTFNEELRTDKPVLHYYFMIVAYKLFGVNESAARFFSAILGILTVLITYYFTKRFANALAAFCSSLVLVASTHFLFEFRLSVPDPYLIFFITGGLLTAFTYLQENKFIYLLLASISFALATLAKGPVALALPGLCLLIWIILKKKWKLIFTWKLLPALMLLAIITLPWYIAVDRATNHAWTRGFFIEHNINRFSDPAEGHGGFFLVTILFVVIGLLPFSAYLGEVIKTRKHVFTEDLVKFSGIVVLAFVAFFSVSSTKLPNYPMPCYPFAAIILGSYLSAFISGEISLKKYPAYILFIFGLVIPIAGYIAIGKEKEAASLNWLALLLLIAPVCLFIILLLWKRFSRYKKVVAIVVVYTLFNVVTLHFVYPTLYKQNPVAKTLSLVREHSSVYSYMIYNAGYNFYLDKPVKKFFNVDSLKIALTANPSAIVITRTENAPDLQKLNLNKLAEHHDLFELPTTVLYVTKSNP